MSVPPGPPRPADAAAPPVVIIGAGPVGLAAAAHLLERGIEPLVLEQGSRAGAAVLEWGHIRLFSPWRQVVDPASVRLLEAGGWTAPAPDAAPTGAELVEGYLAPLAETAELRDRIRYGTRVEAVSRVGMDRTRTTGRAGAPFTLLTESTGGADEIRARAVIDASGTLATPNPVLASGLPLRDHAAVATHLSAALPDVLGRDRRRFAEKHTVVVGAGHSAANALIALARLSDEVPGTAITWLIRTRSPIRVGGSDDDRLARRAALGRRARELVGAGTVDLVDGFLISDVLPAPDHRVEILGSRRGEPARVTADSVIVATGYRPDLAMLREIRLELDVALEAPARLAPLIDPNVHSCGTVPAHGVEELSHPEPGFWLAGMKSYGRAPTFLLRTGYGQVRSIADEIAGAPDEARQIRLEIADASARCCA